MNRIHTQTWLEQPRDIREHLMKVFGIVKTGIAEIRDQEVVSDGVTNNDLLVISTEKMTEYIGSTADSFARLWEITISKAKFELNPPKVVIGGGPVPEVVQPEEVTTTKFCDTCNSKGGRHLKVCPKFK